jgi:DNA-binding beta-propeller fold protein YncE
MPVNRRSILTGGALLALAASAPAQAAAKPDGATIGPIPKALKNAAVYVPGYFPEHAYANGKAVAENRRFNRAVGKGETIHKMLTRVGFDGSIRQTLLPVAAHDVEVAPDRSIGVLCSMDGEQHSAFDPETLELAAIGPSLGDGWHGGGHAVYLDGGKTVILSERAPSTPYQGKLEKHYGRLTVRDPKTLKITETYSTHGIDPHDIRLTADGKHIVAANYGSTISAKTGKFTIPRSVVQASITVVEVSSGKLVDKRITGKGEIELRHLAVGRLDRIFAIQARYGSDHDDARQRSGDNIAYESDITTDPGYNYMSAATLKYDAARNRLTKIGDAKSTKLMRHGLSIRYDERHDEAIATYPSTHHVMVFDGATGDVSNSLDTRSVGLRYPAGVTFLPDGKHYAVTGHWENMFVFERGTHRLVRELCLYPLFFGHSHITAA